MIDKQNNKKGNVMDNLVVRIEKSGNRFNAFDSNGQKYTSQITTGARKGAYNKGMALEQRVNKSGKTYWWAVPMSTYEATTSELSDILKKYRSQISLYLNRLYEKNLINKRKEGRIAYYSLNPPVKNILRNIPIF